MEPGTGSWLRPPLNDGAGWAGLLNSSCGLQFELRLRCPCRRLTSDDLDDTTDTGNGMGA